MKMNARLYELLSGLSDKLPEEVSYAEIEGDSVLIKNGKPLALLRNHGDYKPAIDFCGRLGEPLKALYETEDAERWYSLYLAAFQTWRDEEDITLEEDELIQKMLPALEYLKEQGVSLQDEPKLSKVVSGLSDRLPKGVTYKYLDEHSVEIKNGKPIAILRGRHHADHYSPEVVVDFCGPYAGSLEVVYRGTAWQGASWLAIQNWRGGANLSREDQGLVEDMMPALDYLREEKVPVEGEEEYSPPIIVS